jgi:cytochrome b558/566 subunit A
MAVPSGYMPWMVNITTDKTYYVAFAVWQGKLGETLFDKSITPSFLQLTLVNSPPTSTTSSAAPSLLSSPSAIVTIVGTIIAVLAVIVIYVVFRK